MQILTITIFLILLPFQSIDELLDKGYEYYQSENFNKAIETFNKALKIDPVNPETYLLRALSYYGLQEVEKSVLDLEKAIELDETYISAYSELGYIYLVGQAPKKAIEAYNKAIKLDPESGELYVNRGTAKCMLNDSDGAEADWKKAQELGVQYSEYMTCN